jgi:hypothetical protein
MVRREPSNEICKMKVVELKQLAKENNVRLRGSDGKPKLKCDLMTDTILSMKNKLGTKSKSSSLTRTKTEKIFKPTSKITINPKTKKSINPNTTKDFKPTSKITINPKTKKSIKPTTQKLTSITPMSDDLLVSNEKFNVDTAIEKISDYLNICLTKYYKRKFRSLNKNEKKTIKNCYEIYKDYDDVSNDVSIIASIIIYYYVTLKLSYRNPCIAQFYKIIEIYANDDAKKMVLLINDSKTIEMAQIRNQISKLRSKSVRFDKSINNKTRKTRNS